MRRLLLLVWLLLLASPVLAQTPTNPVYDGLTLRNCTGSMTGNGAAAITCGGAGPSINIIPGTNVTTSGTCNSTNGISCTVNATGGGGGNPSMNVRAVAGASDTILSTDVNKLVTYSGGAAVTLPQATGSFAAPFCFAPQNTGASPVVITPTTSTINGASSLTLTTRQGVVVCSDSTNWQIGYGGLGGTSTSTGGGSFLNVTDPSVGMVAGAVDNAPQIAALMAAINPGAGSNAWTGGGNVVFPTVFGQTVTTYYFKQPLRLSRGGTYQCGISASNANFTNLVFDPGVDGVVQDSNLTSVDGGLSSGADILGCGIISLGVGTAKSFNGSNTFTNVLMNGFGTIPAQPWTPGDGILSTIVFPEVFSYIAFIGGSSYTASISGATMTVTNITAGTTAPAVGQPVAGSPVAVPAGTLISASCGANCWTLNQSVGTIASEAMYDNQILGNVMTVTTNPSNVPATAIPGVIAVGQYIQSTLANEATSGGQTVTGLISGTGGQGTYTLANGTQALDAQGIVSIIYQPVTSSGAWICATATAFISPCTGNAAAGSITLAPPFTSFFFQPNGTTPVPVKTWRMPLTQAYATTTDYGLIRCAPTPCTPFGAITGGTGGTPGTYANVPFTGGSGTGAVGTIVVGAGGNVTGVTATISGVGVESVEGPATTGMINQPLGAITGGTGGTPGVYYDVPFTGGTGTAAKGIVTVGAGGNVTGVTVAVGGFVAGSFNPAGNSRGYGYTAADVLSAASGNIGGTTGFSFIVASVSSGNSPGINYVVGDVLSAASGNIGGVTGFSVPVASIMGNSHPTVRSGPRPMAQGDELWSDAYPMGSIVGAITPQLTFPQFPAIAQTPTMAISINSTVAHASGSGKAWNLPAGLKRRLAGRSHKNYVNGWVFGLQMTCSAGDGMNCTSSADLENTYQGNFIGRLTGGDNSSAVSFSNLYGGNYQFDVAELGTIGSGYFGDSYNSCEGGTSHYCYIQNCSNLNFSTLYSIYIGNQASASCPGSPITPFTLPTTPGGALQIGPLSEIASLSDASTISVGNLKNCWSAYNAAIGQALRLNCQGNLLSFSATNNISAGYALSYNALVGSYDLYANNSTPTVLERFPSTGSGILNYTGTKADSSEPIYPHGVLLGGTPGAFPTPGTERWLREMAAKPVEALNIQGNVAFNNAAVLGGTVGWVHTSAGSSGATPFGPIANDTAGNFWTFPGTIQTTITYSAAGTPLPTCNSAEKGAKAMVSDATGPTYLGTYASGGAVIAPVFCNGSNWLTD